MHQALPAGEFIAEAQAVVEQAETHVQRTFAVRLPEVDQQFVIMVADLRFLAPDRLPDFVEGVRLRADELEAAVKVDRGDGIALEDVAGLVLGQPFGLHGAAQREAQAAGQQDIHVLAGQGIIGDAVRVHGEFQAQRAVRRGKFRPRLRRGSRMRTGSQQGGGQEGDQMFHTHGVKL